MSTLNSSLEPITSSELLLRVGSALGRVRRQSAPCFLPAWSPQWPHMHVSTLLEDGSVRNAAGRKSHLYGPLVKAFIGRSLSGTTPRGRVSKETKGVCEVGRVRKGFIAMAGFPYKEESAGFSGV